MSRIKLETFDNVYYGRVLEGASHWAISRGLDSANALWDEAKIINKLKPRTVLDYGCGRGEIIAMLAHLARSDNRPITCIGYDPAPVSAQYRELTFREFEVEDCCHGCDSDFSLPDRIKGIGISGFDVVIGRNLYECLDPDAVPRAPWSEVTRTLAKLRRNLRPSGRVLIKTNWHGREFSQSDQEIAYQAYRNAGQARHLVPWDLIDDKGRLYLRAIDAWQKNVLSVNELYRRLNVVNQWTDGHEAFVGRYYPDMAYEFDGDSGWLALAERSDQ